MKIIKISFHIVRKKRDEKVTGWMVGDLLADVFEPQLVVAGTVAAPGFVAPFIGHFIWTVKSFSDNWKHKKKEKRKKNHQQQPQAKEI